MVSQHPIHNTNYRYKKSRQRQRKKQEKKITCYKTHKQNLMFEIWSNPNKKQDVFVQIINKFLNPEYAEGGGK